MTEDKYSEKWMNKRLEQHQQAKRPIGGIYYWVFAKVDNKIVCCGYKPSEEEANDYAYANNLAEFSIFPSKSRDINKVVREAKGKVLNDTHDISEAMQRMKRKM
jgi:hypothetical protein